jgi:hypothetical protein
MPHRLDTAVGRNAFDRRLGNFRVQIQPDAEGEFAATMVANLLAPGRLADHEPSSGLISTVEFSIPAPDALRLAVFILREARRLGLAIPAEVSSPLNTAQAPPKPQAQKKAGGP